nr:coiled-coil domain-containing protein 39 [Leptinotarsa decemlineata]
MTTHLGDVLRKLGWSDGFQIPIANVENKALEEELAILTLKKSKMRTSLDIVSGRLEALKDHFKFVNQENDQTQKLITAHKQQLENVENQYHVIKSEKANTVHAIHEITDRLKASEERLNTKKISLQKGVTKAEHLKTEMDWDAEALKAWEESLKKRDEDIELLKKFSKEDERRYNELEAKRQHLQTEVAAKRGKVAKIAATFNNYELVIERSGKVLKQLMTERDALITQWKDTVKMLQQRDNDIMKTQEQMSTVQEMIQKQQEKLSEEDIFLKNEQRNNHEIKLDIQNLNAVNSRMRRDYHELVQHTLLINGELHALKRQVAASSLDLENERIRSKRLDQTFADKEILCDKYRQDIENLEKKFAEVKGCTMSSEERIKRIEKLINYEERLYDIYISDTEKINSSMYRIDKFLKDQKSIGKILEIDLNNANCNCAQLRKHIQSKKKDLEKIKEVVYDMEYRIDDTEKKLYTLLDESKKDDLTDENEKKILELEKVLANHKDVQHALQNQVDRLQEEMRRLTLVIATDKELVAILQNKCENHLLVYEIGQKQIAAAKKATQEKQVEENMVRLRVHHIEMEKKKEEKEIFTLEKLRLNLDQVTKERQLEINTQKTITQIKKRSLEEDRGRLRADIALRRLKIEQIKQKYHVALGGLGNDENGQPLSLTHFKIKNAQEKFILQQEGDELDQKIKTAEKDIIAMENTLKVFNLTNASFKNSLAPVKEEDEEVKEMKILNIQFREINNTLKSHKNELAVKEKELEDLKCQLQEIQTIIDERNETVTNLEEEINLVRKQEFDKADKLKRVEIQLRKLMKKVKNKDISKYNRDFEIRQLQDVNKSVIKRITELAASHQEMSPLINRYIMEYNIQIPESRITPSTYSSFSSSRSFSTAQNTERSDKSHKESIPVNKVQLSFDF